jgi:Dockerin type I domain
MFKNTLMTVTLTALLLLCLANPLNAQHNPGDANGDGSVSMFDAIYLLSFLCTGGPPPDPLSNGDANGDCVIDVDDVRLILYYQFLSYNCVQFPDTACTNITIGTCEDQNQNLHDSSFCDPVFPICPLGDAAFRVHLRNEFGDPVDGLQAIWVELYSCSAMHNCLSEFLPTVVCARGPADENGILSFYLDGGNCDNACYAVVKVTSVEGGSPSVHTLATVPVKTFDTDGDLLVSFLGDYNEDECNDYNGDDITNTSDATIFSPHIGHSCDENPCDMFLSTFRLIPESNLQPGQVITLELALANNGYDTCFVEDIGFYESPFSAGGAYSLFHTEVYGEELHPGEKDTISIEYTIPDDGQGCLKTILNTSCCVDPVESMPKCFQSIQHCVKDSNVCYTFNIPLDNLPVENIVFNSDELKPGWTLVEVHVPSAFPITSPDYIEYQVCTPNMVDLGDSVKLQVYVCYDVACSDVDIFETRVVISSRTGDANGDCDVNVSDAVHIINYVFVSGSSPPIPYDAGDVNCDLTVNVSDAVWIINYVFIPGSLPPCLP